MECLVTYEKRINEGYEIIEACPIDDTYEVVLGKMKSKLGDQYVTWLCGKGTNYFWGHYFFNHKDAMDDFRKRVIAESSIK